MVNRRRSYTRLESEPGAENTPPRSDADSKHSTWCPSSLNSLIATMPDTPQPMTHTLAILFDNQRPAGEIRNATYTQSPTVVPVTHPHKPHKCPQCCLPNSGNVSWLSCASVRSPMATAIGLHGKPIVEFPFQHADTHAQTLNSFTLDEFGKNCLSWQDFKLHAKIFVVILEETGVERSFLNETTWT